LLHKTLSLVTSTQAVGGERVVDFSILGPLEVTVDGVRVEVQGPKERALLAFLLANAGDTIPADRLAEELWEGELPRSTGKAVQNLVLRLRKLLGSQVIETRAGGYALVVAPDAIDAHRFERLIGEGRDRLADLDAAAALPAFRSALDLWRGEPLTDLADWPSAAPIRTRLEEVQRSAWEEAAEAGLALGDHRAWVTTLQTMVAAEPLRERRWELLMVALYRSGRQADALRAYQRARAALADIGLEPGPELRSVEEAVSQHDRSLAISGGGASAKAEPSLPTGIVTFLLTDIEGSSALWEQAHDEMIEALQHHDDAIRRTVATAGGFVLKARGEGDSTFSVFSKASAAVAAALAARDVLTRHDHEQALVLPVRFAVHVGEAHERDGDYYGPTVNRAARLRSAACGNQIVLSESVAALVRDELPDGWDLAELGDHTLRGLARPERVFTLVPSGGMAVSGATVVARSCPYMGLLAFQPEDERLFFGRARLVAAVVERLERDGFVAVVGPSGSGKSSLLRAGAIAGLRRSTGDEDPPWLTVLMTPGARPLAELAAHVARLGDLDTGAVLRDLESQPRSLDLTVRHILAHAPHGTRFALVIDQFEELFTLCKEEHARQQFLDVMVDAAAAEDRTTHVAIGMRADFYGRCTSHDGLADLLGTRTLLVGVMDEDGIRAAIEGPAAVAGLKIEAGLRELITRDVTGEPGALPLLSHALLEMWSRREGRTLTIAGYHAGGGVESAIGRTAEAVYEGLTPEQQGIARRVFLRLTELGEGTEDTRRRVTRDEFAHGDDIDAPQLATVLDKLANARLVTVSDNGIDVAHEALIRQWPRLRSWLDDDRDGLRVLRRITNAARVWDEDGRDDGDLYRGARLAAVMEWRVGSGHARDLNLLEREYLDAAEALHDTEELQAEERVRTRERSYRVQRRLLIGTAIALVIALTAGALALDQRNRANAARNRAAAAARAQEINSVATLARTLPTAQSDLALLLGVEAHRLDPSTPGIGGLESALVHAPVGLDEAIHLDGTTTLGSLSPDGRTASVPLDTGAEIIDVSTGATVTTLQGARPSQVAFFSPDGQQVVTGGIGTEVQFWDARTGRPSGASIPITGGYGWSIFDHADPNLVWVVSPSGTGATVAGWDRSRPDQPTATGKQFSFPFEPTNLPWFAIDDDGTLIATGSTAMGQTIVWDVTTHTALHTLPGATGGFIPGTHLLATAGNDRVTIWNAETGQPDGAPLLGFQDVAGGSDAISPDGHYLAAVDADKGIRTFDLTTRQPLGPPLLHSSMDLPIGFLPDGRLVSTGGNSLLVWRTGTTLPTIATVVGTYPGPAGHTPVLGTFVPGSDDVITQHATDTQELQRWNARTGTEASDVVNGQARAFASVNADGSLLVAPLADHSAFAIWDLRSGTQLATLPSAGGVMETAWAPHSTLVVTSASDQKVHLWDVADPRNPIAVWTIDVPLGAVPSTDLFPVLSDDGRLLAVADTSGSRVSVFEVASGRLLWSTPLSGLSTVAFSPDGRTLAVLHTLAGSPQQVDFHDATTGKPGRQLDVPGTGADGISYILGGAVIVTTSDIAGTGTSGGAVAQLWDAATLQSIGDALPIGVTGNYATNAAADGSRIVTGTIDGHAVVWDLDSDHWTHIACRLSGRNLTKAEWARYLPNEPYHVTCAQWPPGT
jgi:DNA-binding SARP family transcriptional activator/WD40 repeat protein